MFAKSKNFGKRWRSHPAELVLKVERLAHSLGLCPRWWCKFCNHALAIEEATAKAGTTLLPTTPYRPQSKARDWERMVTFYNFPDTH